MQIYRVLIQKSVHARQKTCARAHTSLGTPPIKTGFGARGVPVYTKTGFGARGMPVYTKTGFGARRRIVYTVIAFGARSKPVYTKIRFGARGDSL